MWQEERYQRIRLLLSKMQRVSTDRIMADLNVSRKPCGAISSISRRSVS